MNVFKFGGAALKDAAGIRNVASIIRANAGGPLLIVVSATAQTTNRLEEITSLPPSGKGLRIALQSLRRHHDGIIEDLFAEPATALAAAGSHFADLEAAIGSSDDPDCRYDQIVSIGELLSSTILHHYLQSLQSPGYWLDARNCIFTDNSYREGIVNWRETSRRVLEIIPPLLSSFVVVTQGFIGRSEEGKTTTLGREGSDFTAAIFGACLRADSVTIWKDVAGVMNADPKRTPHASVFSELPFREAAEMTYYGASVIHPKTIKPLANLDIPLLVKNFDNPELPGTRIHECTVKNLPPLVVIKDNQCLISCKVTDYTFISEQQLGVIFNALSELNVRINVMQNSAISFSFCIDFREDKVTRLIQGLQQFFEVSYNTRLTLITVKNYHASTYEAYRRIPGVVLEQSSRSTMQVLVKDYQDVHTILAAKID
jgi:aspartate kinase